MRTFLPQCLLFSLFVTTLAGQVHSAPSGLNVIPTADILDAGVFSLETESAGSGRPFGGDCDRFGLFQVGLGRGLEIGVDRCLDNSDTWLNVKWLMWEELPGAPGIALGIQAIGESSVCQPYLAAMKSFRGMRFHGGVIGIDGEPRLMLGMDRPLGSRTTLQIDYTSGPENSLACGVTVALTDSLSLTAAVNNGNSADAGNGHIINIAWSGSWTRNAQ